MAFDNERPQKPESKKTFFTRTDYYWDGGAYGSWREKKTFLTGKLIALVVVAIFALILVTSCFTTVPTGHTGVVTTFGRVENYTLDSGFHFKTPLQSVVKMDNRVQKKTVQLLCFSSDIQQVDMNYTVNYQISKADAMTIYSTIGKDYYDTVISPTISEAVKIVVAKYTAESLVADRTLLAADIEADLKEKLLAYNIELVSTSIENMDFTDAFENAVEEKQVAYQKKLKSQTEAEEAIIKEEAEAEKKKINADAAAYEKKVGAEAEAEAIKINAAATAEANKMISNSLTDNVLQRMYYERWDGVLPKVVMGSEANNTMLSMPIDITE